MEINEILFSPELKARILDLEYGELTVENIQRIYFEETGKQLDVDITVYLSKDYEESLSIGDNGFDGTVIHFFDEETGTNQVYSIARGSEGTEQESWKPEDWVYNLMGIFVGGSDSQYIDAKKFEKKINDIIQDKTGNIDLTKIALGHSLGGNTKQLQQLIDNEYDKVYVFNDAPPTYYQLGLIDRKFREAIKKEFHITEFTQIYDLDPKQLKRFTENYYKDAAKNIQHTTAKEDFLYNLTKGIRGFVHVGSYEFVDTVPGFDGLEEIFSKIPDSVAADLQKYFAGFTDIYTQDGFDGFLSEFLGVRAEHIDALADGLDAGDITKIPAIITDINQFLKRLPKIIESLTVIKENLDPILSVFVEAGYIDEELKEDVIKELEGILKQLDGLKMFVEYDSSLDLRHIVLFFVHFKELMDKFENLKGYMGDFLDDMSSSVDAHGLYMIINGLNKGGNKQYRAGDLYWVGHGGLGSPISINISGTHRIYQFGMLMYDQMDKILLDMKKQYENEYITDYEARRTKLMEAIYDMESYPGKYNRVFFTHTPDTHYFRIIRKIDVHEEIYPLSEGFHMMFDAMIDYYKSEIEHGRIKLERMKKLVDSFINKEEDIAASIRNYKMLPN